MYTELSMTITGAMNRVNAVVTERRASKDNTLCICNWRGDPVLAEAISNIKVLSLKLSMECTKLVLVASGGPNAQDLQSLTAELIPKIDQFADYFIMDFAVGCSLSSQLFFLVASPINYLLTQMSDLVRVLETGALDMAPPIAGVITETAEVAIDKNLPATNKVAYRRAIMAKVQNLRETISEFEGYISKSEAIQADTLTQSTATPMNDRNNVPEQDNQSSVEDDINDDDSDEDEGSYTADELQIMQSCMNLLRMAHGVLRVSLDAMTEVGDALSPLNSSASVFTGINDSIQPANAQGPDLACQEWIERVVKGTEVVEFAAVTFGAELYSPLEDVHVTRQVYSDLQESLQRQLDLLTRGSQMTTSYRTLYSTATNAALDEQSVALISLTISTL